MKLEELIAEAQAKSPEFRKKFQYWQFRRGKQVDFPWLMNMLELALGREYVKAAAKKEILRQEMEREAQISGKNPLQLELEIDEPTKTETPVQKS